jgi:hypothetical protein
LLIANGRFWNFWSAWLSMAVATYSQMILSAAFFGLSIFAFNEAWTNHKKGVGHMGKGWHANRDRDPADFRIGLMLKVFSGILFFVFGVLSLIYPMI